MFNKQQVLLFLSSINEYVDRPLLRFAVKKLRQNYSYMEHRYIERVIAEAPEPENPLELLQVFYSRCGHQIAPIETLLEEEKVAIKDGEGAMKNLAEHLTALHIPII